LSYKAHFTQANVASENNVSADDSTLHAYVGEAYGSHSLLIAICHFNASSGDILSLYLKLHNHHTAHFVKFLVAHQNSH
jgi:hypothetical protein